jgi:uncharacterized membrane protein YkoI
MAAISILLVLAIDYYLVTTASSVNADVAGSYTPGSYTASADGFGGPVDVTVEIGEKGGISNLTVTGESETPDVGGAAIPLLKQAILAKQDADVDAVTGEIIKNNKKSDPENLFENGLSTTSPEGTEYISADRAKEIALSHAGVAETNVFDYDCELEHVGGRAVYEIDFESMNYEHDYDIDAVTGEIIRSDKEFND